MSAETERQTPRRVRLSVSDRTPERTHRVGERVDRILERVDRILQGSLGQGRVRRTCRPGSRRRAARRKQAAQCLFPKELNRPSRTNSHHRARAGENATDPRNQPRVASEKEAQHQRRSTQSRSWTPHQPKARRAPDGGRSATGRRGEAVCIEESVPVIIGVGRSLCSAGSLGGRG